MGKKNEISLKNKRKNGYSSEEETRLEKLVFGDPNEVIKNLHDDITSMNKKIKEKYDSEEEIFLDVANEIQDGSKLKGGNKECAFHLKCKEKVKKKAVWLDEDDSDYSLPKALREQSRKLPGIRLEKSYNELIQSKLKEVIGTPKWAEATRTQNDSDDSDNEILKHNSHIAVQRSVKLPKESIEIKVLEDINHKTHTEGPLVTSVEFHPTSTVAFVAGTSGVLSIFSVNGKENSKLHSMQFKKFPINCARFLNDGTEIVSGSMSFNHYFSYDLLSGQTRKLLLPHGITNMKKFEVSPDGKLIAIIGRFGEIHILSSSTKELLYTLQMNKKCNAVSFTPDSKRLVSHGDCVDMYIWDLQSRRCIHRATDEGCIKCESLTISSSGQFLATGSKQGVVNIYDMNQVLETKSPVPLKNIMNLVTSITSLKFNPTSEILAMASAKKTNAFKMIHLPSFLVFKNFPTFQSKINLPTDIAFSPGSGYMSVTNNVGHAYLFKLKHYGNY